MVLIDAKGEGNATRNKKDLSLLIRRFHGNCVALTATVWLLCGTASAQELMPRAYWPTPNGTNVFVVAYGRSVGDIVTDPSLPVTGVDSKINNLSLTYQRTFSLFDRTAKVQLTVPYSRGDTEGIVDNMLLQRHTSGLVDTTIRFVLNLKGAPSMDRAAFGELLKNPRTIVGASLLIQAPTGKYESDRLINIGTNRWSVKPAIGMIVPIRPTWLFEAELGVWFFGDNDDFLGQTREQKPVVSTAFHLIKQIRSGLWASLDANFYVGGQTNIGDTTQANLLRNSRVGVTFVMPIMGRHAIRTSYSTGAITTTGGDFEMFSLSYFYAW